jgi:hypothetical protein
MNTMNKAEDLIKEIDPQEKGFNPILQENIEKDTLYKIMDDILNRIKNIEALLIKNKII